MNNLGERIKGLRRYLKLTQREFGGKLAKSMTMVQRWETGSSIPHDNNLIHIEQMFDVNPTWLRTGEGEMLIPKIDDNLGYAEIMYLDSVYLYKTKWGAFKLAREITQKYLSIPGVFFSEDIQKDSSNIICSQIKLFKGKSGQEFPHKDNPYAESNDYIFIDISHDLSAQDSDSEETKGNNYYLAGYERNTILPHDMADYYVIAQKSKLTPKDFVIGKVIGSVKMASR
jgi:transcriptional regulator with XRE-family HTH domain